MRNIGRILNLLKMSSKTREVVIHIGGPQLNTIPSIQDLLKYSLNQ